ncbi:MAG TPA: HEAT repeat domain-containing protein [Verrucomicrobiae bacterium]|nr:HEAT repeat domain-containing protein [Verrucomicrobiae bacterium]
MLWWTYQQLRSGNLKTRLAAVAKLAESGHADSVAPLMFALKDKAAEIRSSAALAIGEFKDPRTVEPLTKLLRDPVPLVRVTAIQALAQLDDGRVVAELVGMLKDQDAAVRLRAVRSLDQIGWQPEDDASRTAYVLATGNVADVADLGADGVQPLLELLDNGTPQKQLAAIKALSEINDPRIPQLMQNALNKSSGMVRLVALDTLAQLADPATVESVHRLFKDQASNIRAAAVVAAVSFRDKSVLPMLLPMLRDISWEVRLEVVKALGKLGDETAVQGLCRALQDPDHDVRENAAHSLGKLGDPRSIQPLVLALMDVQSFVRTAAHNALFRIDRSWKKSDGARSALPHIMAARNHREYWISHSADRLLEQIRPYAEDADTGWQPGSPAREAAAPGQPEKGAAHPALAILMDLLRDPDRDLRLAAAEALGDLREKSAVPNLLIASRDNDPVVRQAAEWALGGLN